MLRQVRQNGIANKSDTVGPTMYNISWTQKTQSSSASKLVPLHLKFGECYTSGELKAVRISAMVVTRLYWCAVCHVATRSQ